MKPDRSPMASVSQGRDEQSGEHGFLSLSSTGRGAELVATSVKIPTRVRFAPLKVLAGRQPHDVVRRLLGRVVQGVPALVALAVTRGARSADDRGGSSCRSSS